MGPRHNWSGAEMKDHETCAASRLLRVPEVARLLSLSTRSVWKMIAAGRLPGVVRLGRAVRVDEQRLDQFIRSGGEK